MSIYIASICKSVRFVRKWLKCQVENRLNNNNTSRIDSEMSITNLKMTTTIILKCQNFFVILNTITILNRTQHILFDRLSNDGLWVWSGNTCLPRPNNFFHNLCFSNQKFKSWIKVFAHMCVIFYWSKKSVAQFLITGS